MIGALFSTGVKFCRCSKVLWSSGRIELFRDTLDWTGNRGQLPVEQIGNREDEQPNPDGHEAEQLGQGKRFVESENGQQQREDGRA